MSSVTLFLPLLILGTAAIPRGYEPRVINGESVRPGEIPYHVSIVNINNGYNFCGGSIYNENYVITAAHCVTGLNLNNFRIYAGTTDLRRPNSVHRLQRVHIHEKYNATDSHVNDIALIRVGTPFVRSNLTSFVPLPKQDDLVKTNAPAVVSGFGRLWNGGPKSMKLNRAHIFIADQSYCKRKYYSLRRNIYNTHICANNPRQLTGHCKGDSGGPLTVNGKLVGIVSWSKSCGNVEYPSVYTRVTRFVNWIRRNAV